MSRIYSISFSQLSQDAGPHRGGVHFHLCESPYLLHIVPGSSDLNCQLRFLVLVQPNVRGLRRKQLEWNMGAENAAKTDYL